MIKATQLSRGMAVNYEGELYVIVNLDHVAKGNWRSYVVGTFRNIASGQLREVRMRSADTIEQVTLDKKQMEYLYSAGSQHHLMDLETYEQLELDDATFGDARKYLKPNTPVEVQMHAGKILELTVPNTVELEVKDTPPAVKGATATAQTKPATLETGLVVTVPPFISIGEVIRVDTRTGKYLERAKG
jgi:elongation factor P